MTAMQATNSPASTNFASANANAKQFQKGFGLRMYENSCRFSIPRLQSERRPCVCAQLLSCVGNDGTLQAPHGLFLHDLMDQAGIDTYHAKAARKAFAKEVVKLERSEDNNTTSHLDLARAALEVASEDDALVSHSAVALPVDSYLERLNSMAMEFARHHMPSHPHTPDAVLMALDNYLYGYKSFQRTSASHTGDARDSYLNMVLTRRLGSPAVLAILYSELVKILNLWGVIEFVVDMIPPTNNFSLSQPLVRKGLLVDTIMDFEAPPMLTPKGLLAEILTTIKDIYWPWKLINGSTEGSNFLKAADAANQGIHMTASAPAESLFAAPSNIMGSQVASARAAKHRLQRGIWTSTSFGDMRRALAASERLVLLGTDRKELRDYGILLYHCGLYEPSLAYLSAYNDSKIKLLESSDSSDHKEAAALENILLRLRLILAEQRWSIPAAGAPMANPLADPW